MSLDDLDRLKTSGTQKKLIAKRGIQSQDIIEVENSWALVASFALARTTQIPRFHLQHL